MPAQRLPQSAESYAVAQRVEIAAAVAAVRRQWRRVRTADIDASYAQIERTLLTIVTTAQTRVAAGAQAYVPTVLHETGQIRSASAFADVTTAPLVGVAGDGRRVDGLLYRSVIGAKTQIAQGTAAGVALVERGKWLSMAVGTLLSDTARASESLAMGVRPIGGYVRMLTPPSCSRCVVLAGKWFRRSQGFQRHPGCDCRHIPASESVGGDLTVDPADYFNSLTDIQADKTFGKAGAEAIRSGADMAQVVNARRGMGYAQVGGRRVLATSEGTTRRGLAARSLGGRPRLMPETIQNLARDRGDYLRLLRANGYI